jgi:hypothetical protein
MELERANAMATAQAATAQAGAAGMTLSERADAHEEEMMRALEDVPAKSVLYTSGELDPRATPMRPPAKEGQHYLMKEDPRLPQMPKQPTLIDFFNYRLSASKNHLLQSATHALKAGCSEKVILACLLHDIAVVGFIRCDHGYWGAQLIAPYVDEEIAWAIRAHQALRFYPDEAAGYAYPELYIKLFGEGYQPEPYIERDYQLARAHKWYGTARLITVNDIYSFDPNAKVFLDDFVDIIGRNFRQPEEGLGYDDSPSAHMWRTIIAPTRFL